MHFEVRLLAPEGVVAHELEAADEQAAVRQAGARGFPVLSVRRRRAAVLRTERFDLVLFTQELLALLRAGLGLIEAIRALAERQSAAGRATLQSVLALLRDGKPLSAALEQHPQVFPVLYIETVRAAERTGAIAEALSRFVQYQGQVDQIRQKLISALIYPAMLMVVGIAVCLFLIGYVVPRFSGIYLDVDRELPFASRLLFELGALVDRYALLFALALAVLVATTVMALRSRALRIRMGALVTRLPFVGERLKTYRLTRLYRTVAMLLHGGVPLLPSLRMVSGLLDQASREQLEHAMREVREGGTLSAALQRNALTTVIAQRMLEVGERSGNLSGLMEQAAQFHEDELARWVERATRLLEPTLMLLMGLLIGGIVVLMYLPIFDLAGTLQ